MIETLILLAALAVLVRLSMKAGRQDRRIAELEAAVARLAALPSPGASAATPDTPLPAMDEERPAEAAGPPPGPPPLPEGLELPPMPPALPAAPPARPGLEETLGTRWAVWAGGLALGLGGIFLVRYSIEQGLVGPGTRIALGILLALALLAGGEWLRRRGRTFAAVPGADIPAILAAAGTSTAFATVWAAYGLYGFIGPTAAFVALGLVSLLAMAAAILHGPALAGLGLAAALASPLLVDADDPSPFGLVLYLVFATGAAYGVARLRLWRWLAIAAAAGALLWGLALTLVLDAGTAAMAHVVVQLALAILFLLVDPHRETPDGEVATDRLVSAVLAGFACLAAIVAGDAGGGLARPVFAGAVILMLVGAAYRYPAGAAGAAAAAFATLGTLALWPVAGEAGQEPIRVVPDLPSAPWPEALGLYISTALALNALVTAPSLWRIVTGPNLPARVASWYIGAATLGPLACLIVAYWRVTDFDRSLPFGLVAAGLGAGFASVAAWLMRRRATPDSPALQLATGATAAAAPAALAAGLTFALDQGVLTVSLALAALGTAFVADRTGLRALRLVVAAMGLAVAARLAWDPGVVRGPIGTTPILNWLLWGYGAPAAAFGLAAHLLARGGRDLAQRVSAGLAILFSALLVFLEIRHALHAGDPFAGRTDHLEAGLVVTEALGFTLLLQKLDLRRPDPVWRWASLGFAALSLAGAALALLLVENPALGGGPVRGGALFNSLAPAYLMPAALAAAIAWTARARRPRAFVLAAAGLSLALGFAYATLEIRRLFQGPNLDIWRSTSEAELWCYSLALLGFGAALLGLGLARGSRLARLAGLGFFAAAALKVFLVDMGSLGGLTRALSFVGLGLALVGLGLAYQRLLRPRPPALPGPGEPPITRP